MTAPHQFRSWLAGSARRAAARLSSPSNPTVGPEPSSRSFSPGKTPAYGGPRDINHYADIPCFGLLPEAQAGLAGEGAPSAVAVHNPTSPLAAAFRNIHEAFLAAWPDVQVVALASALPGDGKTTCAMGLARQSALAGFNTVLVDCDLRRGSSSAELPTAPQRGLLEMLAGGCSLDDALAADDLTPLCILPVVKDMDAIALATNRDVFATEAMLELMAELRRRFDYVFLDTPPLLALVDARRLAPLADTFLLLARWRQTPKPAVLDAIDLLRSTETPLAGIVLTRASVAPA